MRTAHYPLVGFENSGESSSEEGVHWPGRYVLIESGPTKGEAVN